MGSQGLNGLYWRNSSLFGLSDLRYENINSPDILDAADMKMKYNTTIYIDVLYQLSSIR